MANKVLIALNASFNWGAFVCAMQRLDPSVSCAKTCCQTAILDRPMAMEKAEHDADVGDRGQFKVCYPVFQLVSSESAAWKKNAAVPWIFEKLIQTRCSAIQTTWVGSVFAWNQEGAHLKFRSEIESHCLWKLTIQIRCTNLRFKHFMSKCGGGIARGTLSVAEPIPSPNLYSMGMGEI